ncbi:hypothetical protein [Thermomonas fusca]
MAKNVGRNESKRDALLRENERLRLAIKGLTSTRRYTVAAAITKEAVKYGCIGFFGWLSVRELAGKVTKVDAAVDMCTSLAESLKELVPNWFVQIFTVIVLFVSIVLVKRTRSRNKSLITRLAKTTADYERSIDPKRTSSNLGKDGDTNTGDGL